MKFLLDQDVYAATGQLLSDLGHDVVHAELRRVLQINEENELVAAFLVVEPGRHRFRRLAARE
jgi:hypothetical protein